VLPAARVVYIDRDPAVLEHGTDLVAHTDHVPADVRYCGGDLTEPEALLAALAGTIDFSRPVCLVLALMVQALEPGTARAVVGVLVRALPPGSYLVATVGAGDDGRLPDSVWPAAATEADLTAFFGGLDLLPPGITRLGDVLSGVGVKPYPGRPRG
jgi:O-methyltransferase involved in polyketide biosynthesis